MIILYLLSHNIKKLRVPILNGLDDEFSDDFGKYFQGKPCGILKIQYINWSW